VAIAITLHCSDELKLNWQLQQSRFERQVTDTGSEDDLMKPADFG
jgi:hypothetical protein